ncbi:Pentatricopeptide repeat-containing protein, chloroplastic [Symbiodinium microadriaticum]|uniref:Pentatricopeptide repeat-containing protein, chloroplastic n=1 Tax=Symbiodinium microadriaticum TaxID=2951 RepID=A0A1Q9EII6_SYMMI|nr:Pentatricopeptide repeat-containing protein, chloroplastic [Symbiodinium microadriaticum]
MGNPDSLARADLRRDAIGLAAAMTACEKEGLWQMAVNLFAVLGDVRQDVVTYSTAMAAYGRGSQWEAALVLLCDMAVPGQRYQVHEVN